MSTPEAYAALKSTVHSSLCSIVAANGGSIRAAIESAYRPDVELYAFHPVNDLRGTEQVAERFWKPLRQSFLDLERRDLIVIAGEYDGRETVAMMGHYQGTFSHDWLDVPATHGAVTLRFGEVHTTDEGKIARTYLLLDMLDLMRQAGCWPIAPSLGAEGMWPGPATNDGADLAHADPDRGAETLDLVGKMHAGLLAFDGEDLKSMDHARYWTDDFMWYGPSGIGTTRGLAGFEAHHQIPFLRAFPDRTLGERIVSIAEGDYAVTGGWPSVVATHTGPDWLGLGPTGRRVDMRVMDFYRAQNGKLAENWVPIDVIDILRQLGVDVFDRVRHLHGNPRRRL